MLLAKGVQLHAAPDAQQVLDREDGDREDFKPVQLGPITPLEKRHRFQDYGKNAGADQNDQSNIDDSTGKVILGSAFEITVHSGPHAVRARRTIVIDRDVGVLEQVPDPVASANRLAARGEFS